ncbi:Clavaminate synthase-like protein [Aspergillus ellipticus CBS 707.79]|uniref:Clavaminate synthase-like protein n=1 Tax=Aspergillus ellipticus CBS 707.79 TaxID=1448320 RepID=A0A319EAW0_9EURO|nr:Clavaminate synthase-like protein [Aspergillus ellipticus CBS 707.79]
MTITFEPLDVPGAQTVHGNKFPYGLQVSQADGASGVPAVSDAVIAITALAESGRLSQLLQTHGAVLIRGVGHPSAATFAQLVNAAEKGRGSHPFVQIGLAGKRTILGENIWTANEGPSDHRFYQHNEYSRYTRFPSNIHFYCEKKAPEGGETPVAHSALVYEKLKEEVPELVQAVHERGLAMKMAFRAPGHEGKGNEFNWAGVHSFGQEFELGDDRDTQKAKVEVQVRKLTPEFRWLENDALELTQYIPGIRRSPASGLPVWFNGLVGRYGMTRDLGALEPPHIGRDGMTYLPCDYGDGTVIPKEYLERLARVIDGLEVNVGLEEGDLLLVDNFQVSHGRKPWTGERRILVSMWEGGKPIEAF